MEINAIYETKDYYIIFKSNDEIILQRRNTSIKTWISDEPYDQYEELVCALCRLILRLL